MKVLFYVAALLLTLSVSAADLFVQQGANDKVSAVANMEFKNVSDRLNLDKLRQVTAVTPINALNNYYYWAKRNDINKVLTIYAKKDRSWKRLSEKASQGKSPFTNFNKLDGVEVTREYRWGDYYIYRVKWLTQGKEYEWLDTIYCDVTTGCKYSDMLLRFDDIPNALTGAIHLSSKPAPKVNKRGLSQFDFYPMGLKRYGVEFYYQLTNHSKKPVSVYPQATDVYPTVSNYINAIFSQKPSNKDEHLTIAASFWQAPEQDTQLMVPNYTYIGGGVRVQSYMIAALQDKISKFKQVQVQGVIALHQGQLFICQGIDDNGIKSLFILPLSQSGKFYLPGLEDMAWSFINNGVFANHLNKTVNI